MTGMGGRKYLSYFRMRFVAGLQYRAAALGGIATQYFWGFLSILLYQAFYRTDPAAVPMEFHQLVSYIWLRQALLTLTAAFMLDDEIFETVVTGNVAYELSRPADLYFMWYFRNAALRLSRCVLRCAPILLVAFLLPEPLRLRLPADPASLVLFLISLSLGFGVAVAGSMMVYLSAFYTVSPRGLRLIYGHVTDFLAGAFIPLNFFPDPVRAVLELLPFSAMLNAPLRIYSGNLSGIPAVRHLALQAFWLAALVLAGKFMASRALRRTLVQGG